MEILTHFDQSQLSQLFINDIARGENWPEWILRFAVSRPRKPSQNQLQPRWRSGVSSPCRPIQSHHPSKWMPCPAQPMITLVCAWLCKLCSCWKIDSFLQSRVYNIFSWTYHIYLIYIYQIPRNLLVEEIQETQDIGAGIPNLQQLAATGKASTKG